MGHVETLHQLAQLRAVDAWRFHREAAAATRCVNKCDPEVVAGGGSLRMYRRGTDAQQKDIVMRTILVQILIVAAGACGYDEPETATSAAPLEGPTPSVRIHSRLTDFQNGIFQNWIFQNGVFQNGIFQNGIFQNGIFQNDLWQDAIWQNNPAALEILRTNPYARQVLQYIYECAMSPGQSATLYPGDPPSPDAPAGDSSPVLLQGKIGLAPEWRNANETCDQSCQRWVSG